VVWIGVEDPAGCCAAFIRETTPAIRTLGIRTDERPFTPHVTIGRAKGPAGVQSLARWFAVAAARRRDTVDPSTGAGPARRMQPGIAPLEFLTREVILYESRLMPAGAVHLVLYRWSFEGGSAR
jgi:2'-5' RNA ligase